MSIPRQNCIRCKHFYVTWDKSLPNGCHCYGIKSRYNPSVQVYRATGEGCLCFKERKQLKKGK
ncbi:MAG: uracil-DNA glycosylase [Firmicutes bacterium]|nr:uracil-DNA glycosylase [Bacillota bacterium]